MFSSCEEIVAFTTLSFCGTSCLTLTAHDKRMCCAESGEHERMGNVPHSAEVTGCMQRKMGLIKKVKETDKECWTCQFLIYCGLLWGKADNTLPLLKLNSCENIYLWSFSLIFKHQNYNSCLKNEVEWNSVFKITKWSTDTKNSTVELLNK